MYSVEKSDGNSFSMSAIQHFARQLDGSITTVRHCRYERHLNAFNMYPVR